MEYFKYLLIFVVTGIVFMTVGCSSIAIRTSVEIDAPKEEVYKILADLDSYPNWNPYHRKVVGKFEEGAELKIFVLRPDGKEVEVPPHMMRIVENQEITWGGGIKGIFYGVHSFILESQAHGKTLLKHNEDFSGFAIGFADLPPDVIAEGYQQMNMALKKLVEDGSK
ncbi:SRPBCC domain-containing protein [Hydrogenovibrio sp. SC-1]|uniref:SRPBCC domain-containing protein n=1 Tax=Hydrogenovibrio sp. SC-1 TaxID=2065820 RepID=UPI0013046CEF|nr:SRPBCC domain-containing protein [Hydrogenovibrio sp. SC-1]